MLLLSALFFYEEYPDDFLHCAGEEDEVCGGGNLRKERSFAVRDDDLGWRPHFSSDCPSLASDVRWFSPWGGAICFSRKKIPVLKNNCIFVLSIC